MIAEFSTLAASLVMLTNTQILLTLVGLLRIPDPDFRQIRLGFTCSLHGTVITQVKTSNKPGLPVTSMTM